MQQAPEALDCDATPFEAGPAAYVLEQIEQILPRQRLGQMQDHVPVEQALQMRVEPVRLGNPKCPKQWHL